MNHRIIRHFAVLLCILACCSPGKATNYLSLSPGNYNDAAEVWSLDGLSPCLCTPPNTLSSPSDSIFIRHDIQNAPALTFTAGSHLRITANGSLSTAAQVRVDGASIENFGNLAAGSLHIFSGELLSTGAIDLSSGSFLNFASTSDIAGYMHVAVDFRTYPGSTFILRSNSSLFVDGFYFNLGTTVTETGSCIRVEGDFLNPEIGSIIGEGHITANFNVTNHGIWDTNTGWCAGVSGFGLPTPPNCISCGPLPVELAAFEAIFQAETGKVDLKWTTATELNNDHFVLERSSDGIHFSLLGTVSSNSRQSLGSHYESSDPSPENGINYYRLSQVDQSGQLQRLETEWTLATAGPTSQAQVFPNPSTGPIRYQLALTDPAALQVSLSDMAGRTIFQESLPAAQQHQGDLDLSAYPKGIYLLHLKAGNHQSLKKITLN